jgi:DNA replication and repair protein RecF
VYLKQLAILNFKNYNEANFEFSSKLNAIVGDNGAGKTNVLDAIYYLSFTKSYFLQQDSLNVKHNKDFFLIKGKYIKTEDELELSCGFKKDKKKVFKKNNKEYKKLAEHIGLIPLVMITPSDFSLISGGSEERRKFIDGVISQYNRDYLENLLNYNKVLLQRNQLLKQFAKNNFFDRDLVSTYDNQLVNYGNYIHQKRKDFIIELIPVFQKYYNHISGGSEIVELEYKSQLNENKFEDLIQNNLEKDRITTHTTIGIHKDDIELSLSNHLIRKLGSQGQQKTYLIALKLAQFEFMSKLSKFKPILLFDDIFDKLDSKRVEHILHLVLDNNFGQIFMTDANQYRIERILSKLSENYSVFNIEKGNVNGKI